METDIAREATQTLKDLELEFQEELRLAAASASAVAVTAGLSGMDSINDIVPSAADVGYKSDMSTAATSIDPRQGKDEDAIHGRLRR